MRHKQVVVIGSGDDTANCTAAYELGRFIAQQKWILISGGRGGIMEHASQGASHENGIVIGIVPSGDHNESNQYCNIVIPTGIGYARNLVNILAGDVIVAIGGKAGTLSELAYAWQFNRPTILCSFSGGWSKRLTEEPVDDRGTGLFLNASTLEEVYQHLNKILT